MDPGQEQNKDLLKQFDKYSHTLTVMAGNDERFKKLTPEDIRNSWLSIPMEEQRGILLLAQLQEFFWKLQSRRPEEERKIIDRDINRKGGDKSNFGKYVRRQMAIFEQMKQNGEILGSYYISQGGHTDLERDLDESGVDWILQRPQDRAFVLVQSGTRPGDARDKVRHFFQKFGEKFNLTPFIGTYPILDDAKNIPSDDVLKERIRATISPTSTKGFTPNVISSAFPSTRLGKF